MVSRSLLRTSRRYASPLRMSRFDRYLSKVRGVPIAFACKREATPIKRKLLVPIAAGMVTA